MTDRKIRLDVSRDYIDGSPPRHATSARRRWFSVLTQRWPTLLASAFAVWLAFDGDTGRSLAFLLPLSALCYLVAAAVQRPGAAWVVLLLSIPVVAVLRLLDVDPVIGALGVAAIFLLLGLPRWRQGRWGMPLQTLGMVAFGALGGAVLYVDPVLGGYLVAAGLVGHAM